MFFYHMKPNMHIILLYLNLMYLLSFFEILEGNFSILLRIVHLRVCVCIDIPSIFIDIRDSARSRENEENRIGNAQVEKCIIVRKDAEII